MERTKWLGANAVIPGKVDVLESMESRTLYESTLAQPVPDTTHIRGGGGDGGIPFIQIPGVTSKGMRTKGNPIFLRHKSSGEKFPYDLPQIWGSLHAHILHSPQGAVLSRRLPPSFPVTLEVMLAQPTGREARRWSQNR